MIYEKLWEESLPLEKRVLSQDPPPGNFFDKTPKGNLPNKFRKVNDQIYRGAIVHPSQLVELTTRGIQMIVSLVPWYNLSDTDEGRQFDGIQIHAPCVMRRDLTPERIRHISHRIHNHLIGSEKNRVYVHCLKGQVRTGLVVSGHQILYNGVHPVKASLQSVSSFGANLSSYRTLLSL